MTNILAPHLNGVLTQTITYKAKQRLFFARQLKKFKVKHRILLQFYSAITESILTTPRQFNYYQHTVYYQQITENYRFPSPIN